MRWRNSKAQSSKVQANTRGEFASGGARPAMCVVLCAALLSWTARAAFGQPGQTNLANDSLQDRMNIRVTTVSKTEQKLSQTASAVFVITQEDIAESGATNIPDLLRMVPGMDVAQINANTWAISARGFNARFANMLQVLVDGRSVYTDSFGGVFWDQLDIPLEDIERIEVIRGPGGSVWGGNSVNGIINIITKKASDATLRGQSIEGGRVAVRRARDASELRHRQMVFISSTEHRHLDSILQAVRGAKVLLVGESPGFSAAGGAIQFEMQNDRVRLSINLDAAARAGLRVSSKLLSLATIVHDAGGKRKG
jgi:outer membrane receptor for Fe3+-dicitrate